MDDLNNTAALIVHWPSGPVFCCIKHGDNLLNIGKALGLHVHAELYSGDESCTNCVNEAKAEKRND